MTVISEKSFVTFGLTIFLPLALAACGNSGSGLALKNSAQLPPPPLQENKKTALAVTSNKTSEEAKKLSELAAKTPDKEAKQPIMPNGGKISKPIINAKAKTPPMPVRRPYRKVRKKSVARMIEDQKTSADSTKKVMAKAVVKPKIQTRAVPVVNSTIAAKAPNAEMVPTEAVKAQVAPEETSDLIFGGFIDGSGVNASHEVSADEVRAAKMAQAQTVAKKPSFGQSEFRFSSQK